MIAPPDWRVDATAPWSSLYSDSPAVRVAVVSLHLVPLVLGGGVAVAMDRLTLRAGRLDDDARARQLAELGSVHRWIGPALALTMLSGALLLLADVEQYAGSVTYWTKMGLVLALLVNGVAMMRAERALATQAAGGEWVDDARRAWKRLERASATSLFLWVAITVAGVGLGNL